MARSPQVEHVMQFFVYEHLPSHLQKASKPFADMAEHIASLGDNPEITVALRKLLEAKDAAVRGLVVESQKSTEEGPR